MKINIDKKLVNFQPESDSETADLEALWRLLVGCVTNSMKLAPVGEYLPEKENTASFYIEDPNKKESKELEIADNIALEDGDYYCDICNKLLPFKTGDVIPLCCGKPMELVD